MMTARRIRGAVVLVALSLVGPDPSGFSPFSTAAAAAAVENLRGEWLVTTPQTLAMAKYFDSQIAAAKSPEERTTLERVRDLNIRRVASIVKVNPSHFGFYPINNAGERRPYIGIAKYDVLSATRHEVVLQLDGEPEGRVVLVLSGKDEMIALSLAHFVNGIIWRRAGTPGAGLL